MKRTQRRRQFNKLISETVSKVLLYERRTEAEQEARQAEKDASSKEMMKKKYGAIKDWIDDLRAAYDAGDVPKVHSLLDTKTGTSIQALKFLESGKYDGDRESDAVKIEKQAITLSELQPSQGYIDIGQSVAYPLSFAKASHQTYQNGSKGIVAGDLLSVAGDVILDGHHRWSGTLAQDPNAKIMCRNFIFPGDETPAQKLAAMQMGVATERKPGDPMPFKDGSGDNILGKTKEDVKGKIIALSGKTAEDTGKVIMNDKWCEEARDKYAEAFEALYGVTADDWKEFKKDNGADPMSCPCRSKIVEKMSENLATKASGGFMRPQAEGTPSSRKDMPQLDHDQIGGKSGFEKIRQSFTRGEVNWNNLGDSLEEGVDLKRWNKLAGIIKD